MRVLVCDNDIDFAEKMQKAVGIYYEARGTQPEIIVCHSAEQVLAQDDLSDFQLAFLEVCLPAIDGIRLGRFLKRKNPKLVLVYVSSYLQFAPQGYTAKAFRYLLKDDIRDTLPTCLEETYFEVFKIKKFFSVQINREIRQVAFEPIYYFQSSARQIHIFGENRTIPLCTYYEKLVNLPPEIFENGFIQIGRSTVVNLRYVKKVFAYRVQMQNGQELGISRKMYHTVNDAYRKWVDLHKAIQNW